MKRIIHYCDIVSKNGTNVNITDRVNGLTYCLELHPDEIEHTKKCNHAAIVFLKTKPEKITIKVKK